MFFFQVESYDFETTLHRNQTFKSRERHATSGPSRLSPAFTSSGATKHRHARCVARRSSSGRTSSRVAAATTAELFTTARGPHDSVVTDTVSDRPELYGSSQTADTAGSVQPLRRWAQFQMSCAGVHKAGPNNLQNLWSGNDNKMHFGRLQARTSSINDVQCGFMTQVKATKVWIKETSTTVAAKTCKYLRSYRLYCVAFQLRLFNQSSLF